MITNAQFFDKNSKVVTSSKDSFVKIWDLETQHCVQTIVGHRNEVWSFALNPQETRLITGSSDSKLRVWSLDKSEFGKMEGEELQSSENPSEEVHVFDLYFLKL